MPQMGCKEKNFCGDCEKAIALYEKAFDTKAENIVHNYKYAPDECQGDNNIAHAVKFERLLSYIA